MDLTSNEPDNEPLIESVLNRICSSTQIRELPCLFEFLQNCTPRQEDDLVYGTYCLRHTNATNRTYKALGAHATCDMKPIYLETATCERNIMFLWSFITNVTYDKAKDLISFMDISTTESSKLAKFIMVMSKPYGSLQDSEEYQRLYQYLSAYNQNAIKCLQSIPDRDKILIPINMSKTFIDENRSNNLMFKILNKGERKEISTHTVNESTTQYFVPLTMLNILDQLNILSFRMYCGIDRVSLAPNVSISNGHIIFIGSGVSNFDVTKLYPDHISKLIQNIHGDNVQNNYDILVLLAVPANVNISINPPILIAKRKYLMSTFDIDKLENSI